MLHSVSKDGEDSLVVFKGDIDMAVSGTVREVLLDTVARSPVTRVDLSEVTMIDSSGIAGLLDGHLTAKKMGNGMVIQAPSETVKRVFHLAQLDSVFTIETD